MVYKVQGSLRFATAAARTTARNTFNTAVAARAMSNVASDDQSLSGQPFMWAYMAETGSPVDAQFVYTQLTLLTALAGSQASWHACYHGELIQQCVVTGSKVW
jgi:hypothetical protein